jgi:hypothetical protein
MIYLVDKYTLTKGYKYYIKRKKRLLYPHPLNNFICIFDAYIDEDFVWVSTILDIKVDLNLNEFYRYVSKEEYYIKLKEKYDGTCLNIVLKRLVDESFAW